MRGGNGWPGAGIFRCKISELAGTARRNPITKTALILLEDFLGAGYARSKLYDPGFATGFREAEK